MILDAPFVARPAFVIKIWQKVYFFLLSIGYYFMAEAVWEQWQRGDTPILEWICCLGCDPPYAFDVRPQLELAIWFGMALSVALLYRNRTWPRSISIGILLLNPFLLWLLDQLLMNYLY